MFVSFLMPYVDRGQGPLFQGLMLQQLAAWGADELMFVADSRYFNDVPAPWGQRIEAFGFSYVCPSAATFHRTPRHVLPDRIFANLGRRCGSMLRAFGVLLTEEYPPLREALRELFAELRARQQPEAVLSWCNCPSLSAAAAEFKLPVIHNELGPLRKPHYAGTVYFDFKGVNGRTSAQTDMVTFADDVGPGFQPLSLEELRGLFVGSVPPPPRAATRFQVGAVLQVEDDSNLLAYGNGWTNFELIFAARGHRRPGEVLIRKHPRGYANYSEQLGMIDNSPSSIAFLDRCEEVYTINSSVAFECLLQGKPFTALGDSPAAGLSRDKVQGMSEAERLLCLNYLFLCYLAPESFLYDPEYCRWRLTQPTLGEIYARHLGAFRASAGARPETRRVTSMGEAPRPKSCDPKRTILFVGHEASRTGAPIFLLSFIRWLRASTSWEARILLRGGGPLEGEFRALGQTYLGCETPDRETLFAGVNLIYSNTCTNGAFLNALNPGEIPILTHTHELDYVIEWFGRENFLRTAEQTTHFIACSQAVAEGLIQRQGIASERVSVRHEAISVEVVLQRSSSVSAAELKRRHRIEPNTVTIAACGCADWRKGPDLFLQAAALVRRGTDRPVKFLWIGLLPDDERGRLLKRDLELLGLQETVEFVGEQENPYGYLQVCDLFCLCSREDPFPLVTLEAAALGKPAICFEQAGGTPEFCAMGGGKAVPYLDVGAMSKLLVELIEDAPRRVEFGRRAEQLAREKFDMTVMGPRFVELIERWALPVAPIRAIQPKAQVVFEGVATIRARAAEAFKEGRYEEAADRYARILGECPDDVDALMGQMRCHEAQGHHVLAELLMEQILEAAPGKGPGRSPGDVKNRAAAR